MIKAVRQYVGADPELNGYLDALEKWDADFTEQSTAATLYTLWETKFIEQVLSWNI